MNFNYYIRICGLVIGNLEVKIDTQEELCVTVTFQEVVLSFLERYEEESHTISI